MKKPKISVVMPAYNAEKYIAEAIESILNQTYKNFEFIIVDDCSSDRTPEIIKRYAKKDKRIRYFRNKKRLGCTCSLNVGLRKSKGEYIARMDSDDISLPKRFIEQLKLISKGFDVVGSNIIFIDKDGNEERMGIYSKNIGKIIKIKSPLAHPSVMFKRSFLEKVGYYNEKLKTAQDYDLWIRFYLSDAKLGVVNKILLKYRQHPKTIKYLETKETLLDTINIKKSAKKKGLKLGLKGEIRLFLEKCLLFLPSKLILKLFYLVKGK